MKAGPKVNALVQQHVFGKKVRHLVGRLYAWPYDGRAKHLHGLLQPVPDYSGDIAIAMTVMEQVCQAGYWAQMRTSWDSEDGEYHDGYWCGFTPWLTTGWNGEPDHWTSAETLPLAICLAALKAKGIDV